MALQLPWRLVDIAATGVVCVIAVEVSKNLFDEQWAFDAGNAFEVAAAGDEHSPRNALIGR